MAELEEIIDELYGLPLSEFTGRRNARAKGSPDAAQIRSLAKPSVAAWVVNQLARHRRETLDPVLEVGDRMRAAEPGQLRALGDERRDRVAAAVRTAAGLAAEGGHPISESVRQEVDGTLQAAVRDAAAAAAVGSGRLVRALDPGGYDSVDLDGAVAGDAPAPRRGPDRAAPDGRPQQEARRQQEARAEEARAAARREAEAATADLEAAVGRRDARRRDLEAAEAHLDEARRAVEELRGHVERLSGTVAAADREVREADSRARRARAAADEHSPQRP